MESLQRCAKILGKRRTESCVLKYARVHSLIRAVQNRVTPIRPGTSDQTYNKSSRRVYKENKEHRND